MVAAIRFILDGRLDGPVIMASPQPVTNAEMARAIGAALHRPSALPAPAPALRLALGRELADSLLFASQRAHPAVLIEAGFSYAHPDIGTALEATLGSAR
jgi:NAD dependent epimerase/dehydratase family enzyme